MLDKIGGAMSNGIVGIIAVAAGMTGNATAADMTASNIHIFKICAFYIPLVLIILSLIVFLFKVKITEKMHDEIVKELEVKLANGEIEADDAQTRGKAVERLPWLKPLELLEPRLRRANLNPDN
mgnify:CR=1 FL=1